MSLASLSEKKRAIILLLAVVVIVAAFFVLRKPGSPTPPLAGSVPHANAAAPVTLAGYQTAAAAAVKGFKAGDTAAVAGVLERLASLKVPSEGKNLHFELVASLTAYGQALARGGEAGAAVLERVKSFARANPWLGLAFAD